MAFIIMLLCWCVGVIAILFFGKWVYAICSILVGDKDALGQCNLCEKERPICEPRGWRYVEDWRNEEMYKYRGRYR